MKRNNITVRKVISLALGAIALSTLLASCGSHALGFGVVIWSDNEQVLATGSIVPILDQSTISNTDTISAPGNPKAADPAARTSHPVNVDAWRIAFFKTRKEAATYQKSFEPFKRVYARSERNALPIRSEASPSANMLYKLRQGEVIKVLARSSKPVNESGLQAYWYNVVTGTGVTGWVFGYLLTVYDQGTGLAPAAAADTVQDPLVTLIMATNWRPTYFVQMIQTGHYDLTKFKTEYGFFPDPEQHRFNLVLPDYSIAFDYTSLQQMQLNRYEAVGTSLLITVRNGNELSLQYSYKGLIVSTVFERVDQSIDGLIKAEQARRDAVYTAFLQNGDVLSSTAYGQIHFAPDKKFVWTGYASLGSDVFPPTAEGTGTVSFPLYLADQLKNKYDGVITFTMQGADAAKPTSFLYAFAAGGVRFVYVPQSTLQDNIVQQESFSPLIIFFTQHKAAN